MSTTTTTPTTTASQKITISKVLVAIDGSEARGYRVCYTFEKLLLSPYLREEIKKEDRDMTVIISKHMIV